MFLYTSWCGGGVGNYLKKKIFSPKNAAFLNYKKKKNIW